MEGSAPVRYASAIRSLDDLDKLKVPDPYKAFPHRKPEDDALWRRRSATKRSSSAADQGLFAGGNAAGDGGVSAAPGAGRWCAQRRRRWRRPGVGEEATSPARIFLAVTTRYAYAQIEAGGITTLIGESLSLQMSARPNPTRLSSGPYAKRMVENLKADNIQLAYHICGGQRHRAGHGGDRGNGPSNSDYKVDMPAVAATRGRATVLGFRSIRAA